MTSGLTIDKIVVILVLALILIGPERLPGMAATLGRWARQLRDFIGGARDRIRDEMGDDFDDIDWRQLDPRQYDPRRIIREALSETIVPAAGGAASARPAAAVRLAAGEPAPYDPEAT